MLFIVGEKLTDELQNILKTTTVRLKLLKSIKCLAILMFNEFLK